MSKAGDDHGDAIRRTFDMGVGNYNEIEKQFAQALSSDASSSETKMRRLGEETRKGKKGERRGERWGDSEDEDEKTPMRASNPSVNNITQSVLGMIQSNDAGSNPSMNRTTARNLAIQISKDRTKVADAEKTTLIMKGFFLGVAQGREDCNRRSERVGTRAAADAEIAKKISESVANEVKALGEQFSVLADLLTEVTNIKTVTEENNALVKGMKETIEDIGGESGQGYLGAKEVRSIMVETSIMTRAKNNLYEELREKGDQCIWALVDDMLGRMKRSDVLERHFDV